LHSNGCMKRPSCRKASSIVSRSSSWFMSVASSVCSVACTAFASGQGSERASWLIESLLVTGVDTARLPCWLLLRCGSRLLREGGLSVDPHGLRTVCLGAGVGRAFTVGDSSARGAPRLRNTALCLSVVRALAMSGAFWVCCCDQQGPGDGLLAAGDGIRGRG
jgi:hypothetical protein